MSEFVCTEVRGKVLLLRICYERTLNCLNGEILAEMTQILREFSRDRSLRALVLTGPGRAF